jgi:hypothetical protein
MESGAHIETQWIPDTVIRYWSSLLFMKSLFARATYFCWTFEYLKFRIVTWCPKARIMKSLLGNGSVNIFPQRQSNVTTLLLGQQILGKQLVAGWQKHIPMGTVSLWEWTVFSVGPPRGYITRRIEGVSRVGSQRWLRRKELRWAKKTSCVLKLKWDCHKAMPGYD